MDVQVVILLLILAFVICGVVYDVELSPQGRKLHSRRYRWRRLLNWFPMGVVYAAFYMARYNVAAGNVSSVRNQLGFSSVYMGWVLSAGSWAYAVSSPFTGQITDYIGGRKGMILSCVGAALCNLALGVIFLSNGSHVVRQIFFIVFYAANFLMQGFGTSAVVKINAAWYLASERGVFAGVFNTMLTSGYYLSLGTGSSIIESLGWAYVFIIPGGALLVMSVIVMAFIEPQCVSCEDGVIEEDLTPQQQMKELLKNYTFLGYLAALFFLCWTRDGFLNWFLSFFDDVRSTPLTSSDTAIIGGAWTIGGFVGGILCGWISDAVFKSNRVKPIFIFSLLQAVVLGVIYSVSATCSVAVLGALTFLSSVFILGNYTLLSYTVPTDLPQDIAAGATGIMHAVGYFSTGLSSAVMGNVIDGAGYIVWAMSLIVASVLSGIFVKLGSHFSKDNTAKPHQPVTITTMTDASDETSTCSDGNFTILEGTPKQNIVKASSSF
ncbi:Major Facilitator Superfamily (MFS) [Phytophthora infestans T30-4]|uniref:Major Facilitator Superfamily (MFS) n=1 Tax=Phytophthora infestans (strain T30-4) TaxID=403677 RepID=D0MRN6_PHYIT|nr:Major Facilitator Superfamily (MFS) [Phytophthora infestans T30-4]EEY58155.1 Major Facilitator Superfamily (MFS) [Phytophthora infestans T30-4]|eukprot:XP_002909341.1 Major Facilitator Superfamily (MFS) [Phytophthora infestans T30-4]